MIKKAKQEEAVWAKFAEQRTSKAEADQKVIVNKRTVARNLAAGGVGVIAGTIIFSQGLKTVTNLLGAFNDEMARSIERGVGFVGTSNTMGKAIGDQVRALKGQADAAVAATAATTGMGAAVLDTIAPALKQRAIIEGGNKALGEQITLINSAAQLQTQQLQAQTGQAVGPLQPSGGVLGVTRSTGGLFNTPIGATPSIAEMLAQQSGASGGQGFIQATLGSLPFIGTGLENIFGAREIKTPEEIMTTEGGGAQAFPAGGGINLSAGLPMSEVAPSAVKLEQLFSPDIWDTFNKDQKEAAQQAAAFENSILGVVDAAERGGSAINFVKDKADGWTEALQDQSNAYLRAQGWGEDAVAVLDKFGYAMTDIAKVGRELGRQDLETFGQGVGIGATKMDPQLALQQMMQYQIPAIVANLQRQAQFQRQEMLPAQFALGQAATPYTPFPQTPTIMATQDLLGGRSAGLFEADQEQAKRYADYYQSVMGDAQEAIDAQRAKGREQLILKGVDPKELKQLEDFGVAIRDIQNRMTQKQTNLQVAEYTNSLFLSKRALGDSVDLWNAIHGTVKKTYGGLEGQNIVLSRQLQLLGFAQQQRGINFNMAVAGFMAEGLTPEEIAARQDQAEYEAKIQQRQLNLSKRIAGNQYQQTFITAGRNVEDQKASIALMEEGRRIAQEVNDLQATLTFLTTQQSIVQGNINADLQAGMGVRQAELEILQQFESTMGSTANAAEDIAEAFKSAAKDAGLIGQVLGVLPGTGVANPATKNRPQAAGFLGSVKTATPMTVGEAGSETVAILRNPREMLATPSSGGGSMNVSININANVQSSGDIDELVHKVEIALNRQAALLGLRSPVGS
jgi:hypothetical protein